MAPKIAIKVSRKSAPIRRQEAPREFRKEPPVNKKTPGAGWHPGVISAAHAAHRRFWRTPSPRNLRESVPRENSVRNTIEATPRRCRRLVSLNICMAREIAHYHFSAQGRVKLTAVGFLECGGLTPLLRIQPCRGLPGKSGVKPPHSKRTPRNGSGSGPARRFPADLENACRRR